MVESYEIFGLICCLQIQEMKALQSWRGKQQVLSNRWSLSTKLRVSHLRASQYWCSYICNGNGMV